MAETKTPYEVACSSIKWDKDGNPDHLPVPLADDMRTGFTAKDGRHCAVGVAMAVWTLDYRKRLPFFNAYEKASHTDLGIVDHNDCSLTTNKQRARAVEAAFAEMGYSA